MQKIKAFSLIEIIVGLIIISISLACFAPIINKKIAKNATALNGKLSEKCSATFGSHCKLCQGTKYCAVCDLGCSVDQELDIAKCVCKNP